MMSNLSLEEKPEIGIAFLYYFSKLFTMSCPLREDIDQSICVICPMVTGAMNWQLSRRFTKEDIYKALMQMSPLKSLGPDGFSAGFYRKHWNIVYVEITSSVMQILNGGKVLPSLNSTYIALIPKTCNTLQLLISIRKSM